MTSKNKHVTVAVAAGLFVLAGIIGIGVLLGTIGLGAVMPLGAMLYEVYGLSSFLIPVYLCVAGAFCLDAVWSLQRIVCLAISVVPFFTLAGAEQLSRKIAAEDVGPIAITKILILMAIAILLVVMEYLVAMVLSTSSLDGDILPKLKEYKALGIRKALALKVRFGDLRTNIVNRLNRMAKEEGALFDGVEDAAPAGKAAVVNSAASTSPAKDGFSEVSIDEFERDAPADETDRPQNSAVFFSVEEEGADDEDREIEAAVEKSIDEAVNGLFEPEPIEVAEVSEDNGDMLHTLERLGIISEDVRNLDVNEVAVEEDDESVGTENDAVAEEAAPEPVFEEVGVIGDDTPVAAAYEDTSFETMEEAATPQEPAPEPEAVAPLVREEAREESATIDMQAMPSLHEVFARMDEDAEEEVELAEREEAEATADDVATDIYDSQIDENLTTDDESIEVVEEDDYLDEDEISVDDAELEKIAKEEESRPEQIVKRAIMEDGNPVPLSVPRRPRGPYAVSTDLLTAYEDNPYWIIDDETNQAAENLKATLNEFGIKAEVTGIRKGPVVTMFEILPAPGVKLSKIVALQDNIALRLAASSVRIVAPIPGKKAVGIEIPNKNRAIVSFRECIEQDVPEWKKMAVPVILGKDIQGEMQMMDLVKTPHLLIAGSTGAGKSVCVNSMILSILYKRSPDQVKLILIDPKIVELKLYNDIPHLLTPVITEPKKAMQALQYCLCEMERRYALLDGMGVRDISSYNKRIVERRIATEKLPYLIVVIDEFADLMATTGKQLETVVARLAAMSRAVGIHLVLATQRPSIDVITGLIKANIPSRVAFMVASKTDSRIIIDQMGAEKLLGKGDMLYASSTDPFPVRIQGAFVSDQEVENVVDAVKQWGEPEYIDDEIFIPDDDDEAEDQLSRVGEGGEDPMYDKALDIVMQAGKASASYIQRRLKIGYNRAARLVEEMEERGIVGPANGAKPREIIHVP